MRNLWLGILAWSIVVMGTPVAVRAASPPGLMSYQGVLRSGSTPLEGAHDIVFRFFDAPTGGDALLLDSHTAALSSAVTVSAGTFQVLLGGGTVADGPGAGTFTDLASLFAAHGDLYLENEVDGEVLLPRVRIAASGYAMNAGTLQGQPAAAFVPTSSNAALAFQALRQGAALVYESAGSVRVKPGILGFPDGKVRASGSDLLWSFDNGVGPLGLDAGAEAANTWYYLYAVPSAGNDDAFTVLGSVNAPTQVGGTGPTGAPTARYLGSVRNDATLNLLGFSRDGTRVRYFGATTAWRSFSGSESPMNTWVVTSAADYQPATSRSVFSQFNYDAWGASTSVYYLIGVGAAPTMAQYITTDWGDGLTLTERELPTVNRTFSWYAGLHAWSNNGANQFRDFAFTGYSEDLNEY